MNEHRSVVNRLKWTQEKYPLSGHDCVIQKTPFSFDVSVWEFFWPLFTGARLAVARPGGHQDPCYLIKLAHNVRATVIHFVPSMLQIFLNYFQGGDPQPFRRILCSGEELTVALQNRCLEQFKEAALHNLYGPTEAAVDVTYYDCAIVDNQVRVPIGQPISNVKIYILDNLLRPVPIGVIGEIFIGGVGVGRGYINNEKLTAERFLQDPFNDEGMMLYRTGDTGRWKTDGNVEYFGRNDNQVKIRGQRIETGEIESQLRNHPGIKDVVVLTRKDFDDGKKILAYLILRDGRRRAKVEELRSYLAKVLPAYMIPSVFLNLPSFPLTNSGKLDRNALPLPGKNIFESTEGFVEPQSITERLIPTLWAKALKVKRVGLHDNFFALGGDSLSALEFQLNMNSSVQITAGLIYLHPTVAAYARCIEEIRNKKKDAHYSSQLVFSPNQDAAIKFSPQTYTSLVLEIKQDLEKEELALLLDTLINRHSAFRQGFALTDAGETTSELYQGPLSVVVNRVSTSAGQLNEIVVLLNAAPLILSSPPLMKATQIALPDKSYLHLKISHLISDGWSLTIIQDELNAMCGNQIMDTGYELQAVAQFIDYLKKSAFVLSGANQDHLKRHWENKLVGTYEFPRYFGLFRDRNKTSSQFDTCRKQVSVIDRPLKNAIKQFAKASGISEYGVYFAAYGLMVAASSNARKFMVMSNDMGRPPEFLEAIGFFMNVMPISIDIDGMESAGEFVDKVWMQLAEARANFPLANSQLYSLLGEAPSDMYASPCNAFFQMHDVPTHRSGSAKDRLFQSLPLFSIPDRLNEDIGLDIYWDEEDGMKCYWSYAGNLFSEEHLSFLIESFAGILFAVTSASTRSVNEVLNSFRYE